MRQTAKIPEPVHALFQYFLMNNPPQQFSTRLRRLLLEYMKKNIRTGFPIYFDDFLQSLSDLFDLLDEAALHQRAANDIEKKGKKV